MPFGVLDFPDIAIVYARFAALAALSADLGGWLLLYAGLDRDGVERGGCGFAGRGT